MKTAHNPMLDYHACDPVRKPDWRWTKAVDLCRGYKRARASDDPLVGSAIRYLNRVARRGADEAGKTWPDLHAALAIRQFAGPLADEIEARLLTGVPISEVAEKTAVLPSVVEAYEQFFFNVAQRLDAHDWVMMYAVALSRVTPLTEGKIWKYLAATGGPTVLDVLVDDFHNRPDADVAGRTLLARKGRFIVRLITADWTHHAIAEALVAEGSELFPDARGWLKLLAGLSSPGPEPVIGKGNNSAGPARKRRRRSTTLEKDRTDLPDSSSTPGAAGRRSDVSSAARGGSRVTRATTASTADL
jgi:hypothetical protein